jgi:microcin C transport system substrate-binding protein
MRRVLRRVVIAGGVAASLAAHALFAEEVFPPPGWVDRPSPLADPAAEVGGTMVAYGGPYPKSFNYYLDYNTFSVQLFGSLFEQLLAVNPLTADFDPGLAERWTISDDKKTFTFRINPKARWSDGTPVTAHDVAWTVQAILNPTNMTGLHKISLERFDPPVVLSDREIRFHARELHWENLLAIGTLAILPKHAMADQDFNKLNFDFPVVSGPYRLGELKEGLYVTLVRRDDWWYGGEPGARGLNNFGTVRYRFLEDDDNAYEAFKKGEIDLMPYCPAFRWVTQCTGDRFDLNWIVKQKVQNYNPIGFQGFAMNLRRFPFDDVRVRRAMAHLLDRRRLNHTLMYDQYFMHRSFTEDLYDKDHPCPNELIEFDKEKARALLAEAGFRVNPGTRLLEKDGRPFKFKFLERSASSGKYLVIYQQDLKDVGIDLELVVKDWAAWLKDMDEFNFEMTWAAYSGSLWRNPESMWSSKEAERTAGQNVTGLKDPRIDALIERQKGEFDIQKRNAIIREVDRLVYEQVPVVLLWNMNYQRLLYWNKFGMPDHVLGKFGDDRALYGYWWYDEDAAAALKQARERGLKLPPRPEHVLFDEVFP